MTVRYFVDEWLRAAGLESPGHPVQKYDVAKIGQARWQVSLRRNRNTGQPVLVLVINSDRNRAHQVVRPRPLLPRIPPQFWSLALVPELHSPAESQTAPKKLRPRKTHTDLLDLAVG